MPNINWIEIKNEYLHTDISQRALAKKYGISDSTLTKKANKEKWNKLKKEVRNKIATGVQQKTEEIIIDNEIDRMQNLLDMCDEVSKKINTAISQLQCYVKDGEIVEGELVDTYRLRQVMQSMKDLKDIVSADASKSDIEKLDKVLEKIGGNI